MQFIGFDPSFGEQDQAHWFAVEPERHSFVAGSTGTGKSTLFSKIIFERIDAGDGVLVAEPHGPLCEEIANRIPKKRLEDVVYIEPWVEQPFALNPFDDANPDRAKELVKQLIYTIWPGGEGPETDNILSFAMNAAFELVRIPTFPWLQRFLADEEFRKKLTPKIKDEYTRDFFLNTFDGDWDKRMRAEKSAPPRNKLNRFVSDRILRAIFTPKRSFNFRRGIDQRKIIIVNLSQAKLGRRNAAFIGGVVAFKHQQALLSRQDILSAGKRAVPSYAFFDEFQVFVADVSTYLAEARKYGGSLMLGTQAFNLLPDETQKLILSNCGTHIVYRVSRKDAEIFAGEFGNDFSPSALTLAPDFHFYVKTVRGHVPQKPLLLRAFPPKKHEG